MIEVLLASYNGEKYIGEQIESLLNQDCRDIIIRIRDDCSTDRTHSIISHYAKRYPNKIIYTRAEENSGSPGASFFSLLQESCGDYIFFCDQDDIWHSNKVSLTLAALKQAEQEKGKGCPIMVHTDLRVVDEALKEIAPSMYKRQHLNPRQAQVNRLLVQNLATGCTMAINRAAAGCLKYSPKAVPVHDWWIALLIACKGHIVYLDTPTIDYRQHRANNCGAQDMASPRYILSRLRGSQRARLMIKYGYRQAQEMALAYGDGLGSSHQLVAGYGALEAMPYVKRLAFVLRHKVFKAGIVRKIGQLIFL